MRVRRYGLAWICWAWIVACLPGGALAHGETVPPDLGRVALCTAASSVRVVFEDMGSWGQHLAKPRLERALRQRLNDALAKAGVARVRSASCQSRDAALQLVANVRYLDPKHYVGFGDPAYSYSLSLSVTRAPLVAGKTALRFAAGHSDIHSETRTGRKFEGVVAEWGAELVGDLAQAWRKANPGATSRAP